MLPRLRAASPAKGLHWPLAAMWMQKEMACEGSPGLTDPAAPRLSLSPFGA